MKINQVLNNFKKLSSIIIQENKKYIVYSIFFIMASIIEPFIGIFILKFIIEAIETGVAFTDLVRFMVIVFLFNIVVTSIRIVVDKFKTLYAKYQLIPMVKRYVKHSIEMDFNDVEDAEVINEMNRASFILLGQINLEIYMNSFNGIIISLGQLMITIYIFIDLNIWILLLIVLVSILNYIVDYKIQKRNFEVHKKIMPEEKRWKYLIELTTNLIFGKTVRLHNLKTYLIDKGVRNRKEYMGLYRKTQNNNRTGDILRAFIALIEELILFSWLVYSAINKALSISNFTVIFNTSNQLNNSLAALSGHIVALYQNDNYLNDFFKFIERVSVMKTPDALDIQDLNTPATIEFKDVSFSYPNNERKILKNINLKITSGERITIIGENGAGKTTLVKLLMRLYDVTEGEILYNGINIKEYNYDQYMAIIATVFQDYKIFISSIYENIAFTEKLDTEIEKLDLILEECGVSEKIKSLPKGGHTILSKLFDEDGIELSGGQMQKIALCRTIYKNSPIIVLDEPTASLSPLAEYDLYAQFDKLVKNKTAIYISHRLSSSRISDKICVLEEGEIIEYGTHNDLIALSGVYSEMFRLQSDYYN